MHRQGAKSTVERGQVAHYSIDGRDFDTPATQCTQQMFAALHLKDSCKQVNFTGGTKARLSADWTTFGD